MIKAHKFNDYDYVWIADEETVKEWLKKTGFTEIHEVNGRSGDHIPVEKVLENIDKCEAVVIYTKPVHDNHRLTLMMTQTNVLYYNVLEIPREEIDEYVIPKPFCKRCGKTRAKGEGAGTGCTPNWDDTKDMEWNFQNKTNEPYYPDHDWNRDYEKYE